MCFDVLHLAIGVCWQVFYPTIEDTYEANVDTDRGVKELVRFYDLGGFPSKNREVPRHYFPIIDAYILLYGKTFYCQTMLPCNSYFKFYYLFC